MYWLGRQDSNLRMTAPKAVALPLGHAPSFNLAILAKYKGYFNATGLALLQ